MFFPIKGVDGKKALLNLDTVFVFVEHGKGCIALAQGGSTFEIPVSIEKFEEDLVEFLEEQEDGE